MSLISTGSILLDSTFKPIEPGPCSFPLADAKLSALDNQLNAITKHCNWSLNSRYIPITIFLERNGILSPLGKSLRQYTMDSIRILNIVKIQFDINLLVFRLTIIDYYPQSCDRIKLKAKCFSLQQMHGFL